jgi:hypothetical protein
MAQLDLLTFINTHPSPGSRDNINFWITTGSQGEYFLNGVTIPLENQESELATIISQAKQCHLNIPVFELEGYTFSNDTTNSTVAGITGFTRFSFNNSTLSNVNQVFINASGFQNNSGSLAKWSYISSGSIAFYSNNKTVVFDVTGSNYTGGMSDYFTLHVQNGQGTAFSNNESATVRLQVGKSTLNENYVNKIFTYNIEVQSAKKVVNTNLYHYYLLFKKPVSIRYYETQLTTVDFFDIFFEPSFNRIFAYNDYEVLGNDVQEIRKSNTFLKVDRNFSQLNPTNFEVILDGNSSRDAEVFAEVQDSYYDSVSWNRSRYEGSSYQTPLNSLLPAAHYAVPLDAYIFDTEVSSSALLQDIRNGIQQFPSISSMYFYTPVQITNTGNEFALQISSSALSSTREKITITRISSSGAPAPVTATGEVVLSFFTSNTQGGYGNSERKLFISASIASGSLEYDTRSEYERLTNAGFYITEVSTQVFSRIVSTNIPNTDLAPVASIKTTPDSRLPGLTVFLLDREERTDMIPLAGKKVYDPKTKILYETDGQGLLISTFV